MRASILIAVTALAMLAALPATPLAAAEMTLEELIELVRQNELLYENIDVTVRDTCAVESVHPSGKASVSLPGVREGDAGFIFIAASVASARYVTQGGYYRYEERGSSRAVDGESHTMTHVSAFDGDTTRLLNGPIANLVRGRKPTGIPLRPHGLLLRIVGRSEHLSSFLGGDEAIARDPYGYTDSQTQRTTEYVGMAEYQGLRCHVVRSVVRARESGATANHSDLWLAEDRNFIPVRLVGYEHRISATEPVGEGRVLEWRELAPGIWFPMRAEGTCVDQRTLILTGERKPGWRRQYVVEAVSLDPRHDRSFFQDVPLPPGTIVYEYDGDRLTRSYQLGAPIGGPAAQAPLESRRPHLTLLAIMLAALALTIGYLLRKHCRRRDRVATGPVE